MTQRHEILMTPGPTPVPPEVLAAQAEPLVYHRGPRFGALLKEVIDGLRWLLGTKNDIVVFTSSGTGSMESAVANLISPGDKVLVVSVGYFGERFKTICERFGANVIFLGYEWGKVAKAEDVEKALAADPDIKTVFIQQSETSTGVVNDIAPIAKVVRKHPALLVVDAISSAGAVDLQVDEWGIDVCLGGSQKALGAAPGIAFAAISKKAWEANKNATAPRFYWDWATYKEAAERKDPESPFTPAVSTVAGLAAALRMAKEEGREEVMSRHVRLGKAVKAGVQALGLDLVGESPQTAHVVTTVRVPEGLTDTQIVGALRSKHSIVTGPGQGPLKGQVFRIGHLGWLSEGDIIRFFGALEMVLAELGYTLKFGAGVAAAQEIFAP
jgi:aspartate aminotransferase-like enzyme